MVVLFDITKGLALNWSFNLKYISLAVNSLYILAFIYGVTSTLSLIDFVNGNGNFEGTFLQLCTVGLVYLNGLYLNNGISGARSLAYAVFAINALVVILMPGLHIFANASLLMWASATVMLIASVSGLVGLHLSRHFPN